MPSKYSIEDSPDPSKYTVEDAPAKTFVPGSLSQSEMDAAWLAHMKQHPLAKSNKPAPFLGRNDAERFMVHPEFKEHAPAVLGTAGGVVGALGGPVGSVVGATYGGYLGTGIKRDAEGKTRSSISEAAGGLEQGAYEATGQIGGRVLGGLAKPVLKKYPELVKVLGLTEKASPKAVAHLTAAAATKGQAGPALESIAATIGDIESAMQALPAKQRTIGEFLNAVTTKRAALHAEYGNALGPHANQEVSTQPIADAIRALKKPWMDVPGEGEAEKAAIDAAATQFERPRTVGQLDSLREQLNSDLASLYGKAPNARYTATQGSINNAIDTTIAKGARGILYPIADRAAGKPAKYFKDVLDREGNLIKLRGILQKRISDLGGSQAISEVTSPLSSENISIYAHAGGPPRAYLHGLKEVVFPTRELNQASKHVAKAFPGAAINSLPYSILFSNALRYRDTSPRGPKSAALQKAADDARNPPQE